MGDNLMFEKAWHDVSMIELRVVAATSCVCACQTCYLGYEDVREKGRALERCGPACDGVVFLEFGRKEGNSTPAFSMELSPAPGGGDGVRIEMDMELDDDYGTRSHRCRFFLQCTQGALNGLGRGLASLADFPVGSACSLLPGEDIGLAFPLSPREHLRPDNTLALELPYAFASQAARLFWSDVLLAIDVGFFQPEAAAEHALAVLVEDSPQEVLDLAIMEPWEASDLLAVRPVVQKLARAEEPWRREEAFDKSNYLVLRWLYENRDQHEDQGGLIDTVYDDFHFPNAMRGLVSYLPPLPGTPPLLPGESWRDRRLEDWRDLVEREAERFSS